MNLFMSSKIRPGDDIAPTTGSFPTGTRIFTVSELTGNIRDLLEGEFAEIWVEGEVSDPKTYPSGHTYFTLKDAESQISAVLFKGDASGVKFEIAHGLLVLARGRVSMYAKRGQIQMVVNVVQPKAMGALQLAFEQLKAKLEKDGLFDPARKKPIPAFPGIIGIVTSLQGAAIRDMLSILRRRFEGLHIRIYPVPVQGDGAAPQIAQAIRDFNLHFPDTDVLLVGRGGGSLEDLWAFNEEVVVRAIAASKIPIISCVGHETDFTIADFVADLRAPTPSAAAELVVQNKEAVVEQLRRLTQRLPTGLLNLLRRYAESLRHLSQSPTLRNPRRIYEEPARRVDELMGRLAQSLKQAAIHAEKDLKLQTEKLTALSPLNVLSRGYAIAFKLPEETAIRSSQEVKPKHRIKVRLHKGELITEVLQSNDTET